MGSFRWQMSQEKADNLGNLFLRRLSIKMERDLLTHLNFENTQNKMFSSVWFVILPKTLIPFKKNKGKF